MMLTLDNVADEMLPEARRIVATYPELGDPWEIISESAIKIRNSLGKTVIRDDRLYVKRVLWNTAKTLLRNKKTLAVSASADFIESQVSSHQTDDEAAAETLDRIREILSVDGEYALQALLGMKDKKDFPANQLLSNSAAQKRYERGVHEVRRATCKILEEEYGTEKVASFLKETKFASTYFESKTNETFDTR